MSSKILSNVLGIWLCFLKNYENKFKCLISDAMATKPVFILGFTVEELELLLGICIYIF